MDNYGDDGKKETSKCACTAAQFEAEAEGEGASLAYASQQSRQRRKYDEDYRNLSEEGETRKEGNRCRARSLCGRFEKIALKRGERERERLT